MDNRYAFTKKSLVLCKNYAQMGEKLQFRMITVLQIEKVTIAIQFSQSFCLLQISWKNICLIFMAKDHAIFLRNVAV